jgi:hypothetical protein
MVRRPPLSNMHSGVPAVEDADQPLRQDAANVDADRHAGARLSTTAALVRRVGRDQLAVTLRLEIHP